MYLFIDPRAQPNPGTNDAANRTTADLDQLADLHRLCRESRLYDVERWIQESQPLQVAEGTQLRKGRRTSALEIALKAGNHALALLLLCNGYDPNQEVHCPLDIALHTRRFDLVDLLLEWGADPHQVDLEDLFGTYRSDLFTRFRDLGVDLAAGRALAEALAYHTSNKPLLGFARRHRKSDQKIQTALNVALAHHASEGNEKGVQLCLWAGADPHAPAPSLRWGYDSDDEDDSADDADRFPGFSAVYEACLHGEAGILKRLAPDPSHDDFDDLYRTARSGAVIDVLAQSALPRDAGVVIQQQIHCFALDSGRWRLGVGSWRSVEPLRRLFDVGARWETSSRDEIASVRQSLLRTSDSAFVDLVRLLATDDYCASEILKELARTPAMRARMKKVGFIPPSPDDPKRYDQVRPTRSREVLRKFGVEPPKPRKKSPPALPRMPRLVDIGPLRPNGREIRLTRAALFECAWTQPVATLAQEWGISGPGLKKACVRLHVPVPPRGYWAKLKAGQSVRRPRLPRLPAGQGEEVVIWAPK